MMKRETLADERRIVFKMSYYPSQQKLAQVLDSHLEALDEIERLKESLKARDKVAKIERNNREENEGRRRRALGM